MSTNQFDQMIATLRPETDQQLREYITLWIILIIDQGSNNEYKKK